MEKKQLTKQFFEDHPLSDFSAAQMTFFRMQMLKVDGLDEQVFKMTDQIINQSRRDKYVAEREYIGNLTEAKDIRISCMIFFRISGMRMPVQSFALYLA